MVQNLATCQSTIIKQLNARIKLNQEIILWLEAKLNKYKTVNHETRNLISIQST